MNVGQVLALAEAIIVAQAGEVVHCKLPGYCTFRDCMCACAGCRPDKVVNRTKIAFADAMLKGPLQMLEAFEAWSKARKALKAYEDGDGSKICFLCDDARYSELWDACEAARARVMTILSE